MAASLKNVRIGCWVFILLYWLLGSVFQGATPLQQYESTYQRPITNPGTLQTQRWTFPYWISCLFVTIWIPPLTLAFALEDTKGAESTSPKGGVRFWRQMLHLAVVALLILWYCAIFIYGLTLWSGANGTGPGNWQNPANDPRWCCVWYGLADHATNPGFPCVNVAPCSPGIDATMLTVSAVFLFQLWMGFVFIVALAVDMMLVLCLLKPAYEANAMSAQKRAPEKATARYVERLL